MVLDARAARRDERPLGLEAARGRRRASGRAAQPEGEPDARAAAGDVVVEVAVEALEAGVDVGRHRHQQQLDVEGVQAERARERRRARSRPGSAASAVALRGLAQLAGGRRSAARRTQRSRARSLAQQLVDRRLAQVEPEERVVGSGSTRSPAPRPRARTRDLDRRDADRAGGASDGSPLRTVAGSAAVSSRTRTPPAAAIAPGCSRAGGGHRLRRLGGPARSADRRLGGPSLERRTARESRPPRRRRAADELDAAVTS